MVFDEFGVDILRCLGCGHVYSAYARDQHYDGFFGDQVGPPEAQKYWSEAHERMYADFTRRFIRGRRGRLLDVGCGLGYFVRAAALCSSWDVQGVEISRAAVEFGRTHLKLDTLRCCRVEEAGFSPESFDIITLWDVIEHIPDPHPTLTCLFRILTPGGFLFLHTPNVLIQVPKAKMKRWIRGMRPGIEYLDAKDHLNLYSMNTIRRVLVRSGFSDMSFVHLRPIQSVGGSLNPLKVVLKKLWFYSAAALASATANRWNFDNLFVVAKKPLVPDVGSKREDRGCAAQAG